jgi:hypothetical protein
MTGAPALMPKPPEDPMERTPKTREGWKPLAVTAAIIAPVFAVLWLGMTLTAEPESLLVAVAKILFTILTVLAAIAGLRWFTASGIALMVGAVLAVVWVLLRAPYYPPYGALRTLLLLIVPVGLSGVLLVLAGGIRAGTWPRARPGAYARGPRPSSRT